MKKQSIVVVGILLAAAMAWTAFAQPQGGGGAGGGFGRMREAQQNALAALQEQIGKLKAMMEQGMQAMQGRDFQNMTEDERTKMREEMTQRREEQAKIMASMQQSLDTLKGGRQLATEHQEAMAPLKDILASAQQENAKATAKKIEELIAQRQKQYTDRLTAMGYTQEQIDRMGQPRGQRQQ